MGIVLGNVSMYDGMPFTGTAAALIVVDTMHRMLSSVPVVIHRASLGKIPPMTCEHPHKPQGGIRLFPANAGQRTGRFMT
ncbi:hypothetical protein [Acrocarpospora catenulata]|uniref:hypothetical protein n=1 Tax=Acrocarpospora catenulata TaxID=2836182 RepID=UPI001BDAEC69|nr:hypothetical protein [Acrocarpospora catenulata]